MITAASGTMSTTAPTLEAGATFLTPSTNDPFKRVLAYRTRLVPLAVEAVPSVAPSFWPTPPSPFPASAIEDARPSLTSSPLPLDVLGALDFIHLWLKRNPGRRERGRGNRC